MSFFFLGGNRKLWDGFFFFLMYVFFSLRMGSNHGFHF